MADQDRTTSFAKSVEGLHHEESALDRARALRDQFAHAQEQNNEKQKPREAEKPHGETEKSGSPMIRDDRPPMRLTPNGPMRTGPDRYASATKMGKEHDTADAKSEAARKAMEAFKARQGKSHDHDRDRER
jgi:hypothetical protein